MKMEKLKILLGVQEDGYVFKLHPKSVKKIKENFPDKILPSQLFIAFDVKQDFEKLHGPILDHVAPGLTNLTSEELKKIGGVQIINPISNEILWDSNE